MTANAQTEARLRSRITRIVKRASTFEDANEQLNTMAVNAIKHEVLIDQIAETVLKAKFGRHV